MVGGKGKPNRPTQRPLSAQPTSSAKVRFLALPACSWGRSWSAARGRNQPNARRWIRVRFPKLPAREQTGRFRPRSVGPHCAHYSRSPPMRRFSKADMWLNDADGRLRPQADNALAGLAGVSRFGLECCDTLW